MRQVRVSFIIPTLNEEKHIAACLNSIQNQVLSSEECEVLVVDNGSTDKTQQIVRDLGFNIEVIPGVSVATLRNRGAMSAHGEYLAFVDADVELMPTWLHSGLTVFKDPDVVAAGCFPTPPQPATWVQQTWDLHQRSRQAEGLAVSWLPSMNLLVRRDIFFKVGGFNPRLETAEDVDLCYRIGKHGTILCVLAMEAIHRGEARDLRMFWRKEVWRGTGNIKGLLSHGFRLEELPSIGYPLYILCGTILFSLTCSMELGRGQFAYVPLVFTLLVLPASALALNTSWRIRQPKTLPRLFLLYLVYGVARSYSMVKGGFSLCFCMTTRNRC
jgi:cellulose synthase/poly-beta-1,6-N-acetylglucosamine synthase-like glycosyltransferase